MMKIAQFSTLAVTCTGIGIQGKNSKGRIFQGYFKDIDALLEKSETHYDQKIGFAHFKPDSDWILHSDEKLESGPDEAYFEDVKWVGRVKNTYKYKKAKWCREPNEAADVYTIEKKAFPTNCWTYKKTGVERDDPYVFTRRWSKFRQFFGKQTEEVVNEPVEVAQSRKQWWDYFVPTANKRSRDYQSNKNIVTEEESKPTADNTFAEKFEGAKNYNKWDNFEIPVPADGDSTKKKEEFIQKVTAAYEKKLQKQSAAIDEKVKADQSTRLTKSQRLHNNFDESETSKAIVNTDNEKPSTNTRTQRLHDIFDETETSKLTVNSDED